MGFQTLKNQAGSIGLLQLEEELSNQQLELELHEVVNGQPIDRKRLKSQALFD